MDTLDTLVTLDTVCKIWTPWTLWSLWTLWTRFVKFGHLGHFTRLHAGSCNFACPALHQLLFLFPKKLNNNIGKWSNIYGQAAGGHPLLIRTEKKTLILLGHSLEYIKINNCIDDYSNSIKSILIRWVDKIIKNWKNTTNKGKWVVIILNLPDPC